MHVVISHHGWYYVAIIIEKKKRGWGCWWRGPVKRTRLLQYGDGFGRNAVYAVGGALIYPLSDVVSVIWPMIRLKWTII